MLKRLLLLAATTILIAGCTSNNNPIDPGPESSGEDGQAIAATCETASSGRMLWGYWECVVDLQEETFEAIPMRSVDMHLNVVKYIDPPAKKIGFSNFVLDKSNNRIAVDVSITHPFPGKPNLTGFDVRGIVITGAKEPSDLVEWDEGVIAPGQNAAHLMNADGWTRWWNPVEFNIGDNIFSYRDGRYGIKHDKIPNICTLNGYKLFSDDIGTNEPIENLSLLDRALFSTGTTNTRHYELWFPVEGDNFILYYNYAIDASWEAIPGYEPGDPVSVPGDFPPEANQPEPFRIDVEETVNSLYWDEDAGTRGGTAVLEVTVFDWQGFLTESDVADEIAGIKLECPDCLTDDITTMSVVDPGSGGKAFAVFELMIEGENLTTCKLQDPFPALLTVTSANGDYQEGLTGYSGGSPLSSYALIDSPLIDCVQPTANKDPIACADGNPKSIVMGEYVLFDGTCSFDPDGSVVKYEWDFDGDGNYGDTFESGTQEMPLKTFYEVGLYEVDLEVTDDLGATDTLDEGEKVIIFVDYPPNMPPVAVAEAFPTTISPEEAVSFDGTGSYDTDGEVVDYKWDFDGNGTYGDPYDLGVDQAPVVYYHDAGLYEVDLKVTDNEDAEDTLDVKLDIHVVLPENKPPVACAFLVSGEDELWEGIPLEFDATCSEDPDGTVVDYKWDFDGDGSYGDPYDSGTDDHPFKAFEPGDHVVNVKVTDDGGKWDILNEPIEFRIKAHVIITMPEDLDFKSVDGYEYWAISCVSPEPVPINYLLETGPWNFTGLVFDPDPEYLLILQPDHEEVAEFIPDFFPEDTVHFPRYEFLAGITDGYLYIGEEPSVAEDLIYIHGHIARDKHTWESEAYAYNEETGGPIEVHFPWSVNMDEYDWVSYTDGTMPLVTVRYHEAGVGEGECTVPYNGVFTADTLLTRTVYKIEVGYTIVFQAVLYKWTEDDGKQVARLCAVNSLKEDNFNQFTYEITGKWRLAVLKSDL